MVKGVAVIAAIMEEKLAFYFHNLQNIYHEVSLGVAGSALWGLSIIKDVCDFC